MLKVIKYILNRKKFKLPDLRVAEDFRYGLVSKERFEKECLQKLQRQYSDECIIKMHLTEKPSWHIKSEVRTMPEFIQKTHYNKTLSMVREANLEQYRKKG